MWGESRGAAISGTPSEIKFDGAGIDHNCCRLTIHKKRLKGGVTCFAEN
jgi:hypothetical protein